MRLPDHHSYTGSVLQGKDLGAGLAQPEVLDRVGVCSFLACGRGPVKPEKTAAPMVKGDGAVRICACRKHGLSPFLFRSVNGPEGNVPARAPLVKRIKFIERIDRTEGRGDAAEHSAGNPSSRFQVRKAAIQKITLSPNCIVRGPVAVLV